MDWGIFSSAVFIGLREALEALIVIWLVYLLASRAGIKNVKKHLAIASLVGILGAVLVAVALYLFSRSAVYNSAVKLSNAILLTLLLPLILYFVIFMIRYDYSAERDKIFAALSNKRLIGLYFIAIGNVFREFLEIVLFIVPSDDGTVFAGAGIFGALVGIGVAVILMVSVKFALVKVKLSVILNVLIWFLIIQTGAIFGSMLRGYGEYYQIAALADKIWIIQEPVMSHKTGGVGIPLNIFIGWRDSASLVPFIMQHVAYAALFSFWGCTYWRRAWVKKQAAVIEKQPLFTEQTAG